MNRSPMRRCGKRHATEDEALRSKAGQQPGAEVTSCRCGGFHVSTGLTLVIPLPAPRRRTRIKPASAKRQADNRERRAMVKALYPERPMCTRPGCPRRADDIHEPLTRARGGSIADPENQVPLCRECHDLITFRPESELGWAYEIGLLRHSWDAQGGAA